MPRIGCALAPFGDRENQTTRWLESFFERRHSDNHDVEWQLKRGQRADLDTNNVTKSYSPR